MTPKCIVMTRQPLHCKKT